MSPRVARPAPAPVVTWQVQAAELTDLRAVLELVVEASQEGHLSGSYRTLSHQMGLLLQLCGAVLWRRWRLGPHDRWRVCRLKVIRQQGQLLAFSLTRRLGPLDQELHLMCVASGWRHQGLGACLLADALADATASGNSPDDVRGAALWVVSAHRQRHMHALLTRAGAVCRGRVGRADAGRQSVNVHVFAQDAGRPLPEGLWPE